MTFIILEFIEFVPKLHFVGTLQSFKKQHKKKKPCQDKIDISFVVVFVSIHSIRLQTFNHGGGEFTISTHQ